MKLIHLPTGEKLQGQFDFERLLKDFPEMYIRSELPEHWRVEGYDKSWEWLELNDFDIRKDWEWVYFDSNKIQKKGCCQHGSVIYKESTQISRTEFECHIYNPWRQGQVKFERKSEPMQENEMSFPRASQAGWIEDPADGKLKDPTKQDPFTPSELYNYMAENHNVTLLGSEESVIKDIVLTDIKSVKQKARWLVDPTNGLLKNPTSPRIDYEKANVDYLQTLAESMGYELVKKEKQAIRWESEENRYTLVDGGLHIVEKEVEEGVFIKNEEIEEMIEKYNQYNERSI